MAEETCCPHGHPVPRAFRDEPCMTCDNKRYDAWYQNRKKVLSHDHICKFNLARSFCTTCGKYAVVFKTEVGGEVIKPDPDLWHPGIEHLTMVDWRVKLREYRKMQAQAAQAQQEEDSLISYVKHSPRKRRTPCKGCGTKELYFGHEVLDGRICTPDDSDWCLEGCGVSGPLMLIDAEPDANGQFHAHTCTHNEDEYAAGSPGGNEAGEPVDDVAEAEMDESDPWLDNHMPADPGHERPDGDMGTSHDDKPKPPFPGGEPSPNGQQEAPPWEQDADADEAEAVASQEDDEFSNPEDKPDHEHEQYVTRPEWMEKRKADGSWLKKHAEDTAFKVKGEAYTYCGENYRKLVSRMDKKDRETQAQTMIDVSKLINKKLENLTSASGVPQTGGDVTVNISHDGGPAEALPGLHHRQLGDLVRLADARLHVLMVGSAGVGKGEMSIQVAEALKLPFYKLPGSLNPQSTVSQILGYMQAEGKYVGTLFRQAFEHGGVMFLDEIDNAHPAALASINDMLALRPGQMGAFPDGMVPKHEDFVVLAAANTYGRGPNQTYAARSRGDAATWDRFCIMDIEIDQALEMTLANRTGVGQRVVAEVIRYVRALRKAADEKSKPIVLGPRATIDMCKMIKAGISADIAVSSRCRRGMSDQDWKAISEGVRGLDFSDLVSVTPSNDDEFETDRNGRLRRKRHPQFQSADAS